MSGDLRKYRCEVQRRLTDAEDRRRKFSDGRHPTSHYLAACDVLEYEGELEEVDKNILRARRGR